MNSKRESNGRGKSITLKALMFLAVMFTYNAIALNWNSIEVNDIEYYVQTDKSLYELGENVEMLYRITNLSQQSITYTSHASPVWNFWAETGGQHIWTGMHFKLPGGTFWTLDPSDSVEFPEYGVFTWNLKDDDNNPVQPGEYLVIGGIDEPGYYDYTKVYVPIEVIPEPSVLLLFAAGIVVLRTKRCNKWS
jgi:hypothetical protein